MPSDSGSVKPMWRRVAVLGIGLIGGSFALALRERGLAQRIVGHSPGPSMAQALELGVIDEGAPSVAQAVAGADLVMIAAPVSSLPGLMPPLAAHLEDGAIVTDALSTKQTVSNQARSALGAAYGRFVAGHPIAGAELSGPAAARAELFQRARVVLCPDEGTDVDALSRIEATWTALGAHVVAMPAAEHDALLADLSHWPHVVAYALADSIATGPHARQASDSAGGGLRDTTRIAGSSPSMWADILIDNRDAVLRGADAFEQSLADIRRSIERGDRAALIECFDRAARWRRGFRRPGDDH